MNDGRNREGARSRENEEDCLEDSHRETLVLEEIPRHTSTSTTTSAATSASAQLELAARTGGRLVKPWLSIVLPAHNEEGCIADVVRDYLSAGAKISDPSRQVEVLVVDDASSDNTAAEATSVRCPDGVDMRLIRRTRQGGYGQALRTGFSEARGEWVFFTDGDGQFGADQLPGFLQSLNHTETDMVVGYRSPRHDPPHRRTMGWLWSSLVRGLLQVKTRDINCAYKVFRRDEVQAMKLTSQGALINAELLHKARRRSLKVVERPVCHQARKTGDASGANPSVVGRALRELVSYRLKTLLEDKA